MISMILILILIARYLPGEREGEREIEKKRRKTEALSAPGDKIPSCLTEIKFLEKFPHRRKQIM